MSRPVIARAACFSSKLSDAGFRSECEYSQHGRRRKDQRYVIHNHRCTLGHINRLAANKHSSTDHDVTAVTVIGRQSLVARPVVRKSA
jgi:hypothetical protein